MFANEEVNMNLSECHCAVCRVLKPLKCVLKLTHSPICMLEWHTPVV